MNPIVVTLEPSQRFFECPVDHSLLKSLPSSVPIHRLRAPATRRVEGKVASFCRVFFRVVGDSRYKDVRREAKLLIRELVHRHKPSVVFVTMPPFSASRLGLYAARVAKCPLVVDYRDAWSQWDSGVHPTWLHYLTLTHCDRRLLRSATAVVSVSPELTLLLKGLAGRNAKPCFVTLPNGLSSTWLQSSHSSEACALSDEPPDHWKIGYLGSFYYSENAHRIAALPWYRRPLGKQLHFSPRKEDWKYRSPYFFFRALRALMERDSSYRGRIEFHHIGDVPSWLPSMAEECGVRDVCVFHGYLEKGAAMEVASGFDALLATSMKRPEGGDYCIASKSFDYLKLGKPILGFVCEGAQQEFLLRCGCAEVCDPDNVDDGVNLIGRMADGDIGVRPQLTFLSRFSLDRVADNLADVLRAAGNGTTSDSDAGFAWT
ncbi:MAG: hypothetical protein HQ582_10150 [Planctomycetes bacterium]|nr:hypothetical protein [Planctomycetota bacterium]